MRRAGKLLKCVIGEINRGKGEENAPACDADIWRGRSSVKILIALQRETYIPNSQDENVLGGIWRNKTSSTALSAPEHDRAEAVASTQERNLLRFFLALAIAAFLAATAVSAALAQDAYGGITGSNYPDPYHHQGQYAR